MVVGSRGSPLALAQARAACARLPSGAAVVTTQELRERGFKAGEAADKRRFVHLLEEALLAGAIDLAVHSAKDLPSEEREGLVVKAVLPRGPASDVLVVRPGLNAASLEQLAGGARLGSASPRRAAQLAALRADLVICPLTGNVDTRIAKLEAGEGELDGIVVAQAGLERLGLRPKGAVLPLPELVPAPGQGVIALQIRAGEEQLAGRLAALNDQQTFNAWRAERAAARRLGGGCSAPLGLFARPRGEKELELTGWLGRLDGSLWVRDRLAGNAAEAEALGRRLAERLLRVGGELVIGGAGAGSGG